MAKVVVKVAGGSPQEYEAGDIAGLKAAIEERTGVDVSSYTAAINGNPASDSSSLNDDSLVTMTKPAKAGR